MKTKLIVNICSKWEKFEHLSLYCRFERSISIPVLPAAGQKIALCAYPGIDSEEYDVEAIRFILTGDTLIPEIRIKVEFLYEEDDENLANKMYEVENGVYHTDMEEHFNELGFKETWNTSKA
jgi:hypothetical protein